MKNKVLSVIVALSVSMMLSGCGKSAVKCDDSDAQKTVMEIVSEEIKNKFPGEGFDRYSIIKQSTEERIQKRVAEIEEIYNQMSPTLINIRTDKIDDEMQQSECSADIKFSDGDTRQIHYKLSITTEDKLYAEVFGL